jgi:alpha-tubulin suppressor-like RCC1 family protein
MDSAINKSIISCFIIFSISILCIAKPVYKPAKKVSGGEDHTLILTDSNSVWGYGFGGNSQLGNNSIKNRFVPVQVHGPKDVNNLEHIIAISAGWMHSLALDANGFIWALGALNSDTYYGQLGNDGIDGNAVPVKVHGGEQGTPFLRYITGISAGRSGEHSLALDANGFVYAFGALNITPYYYGQLGNGNEGPNAVPVKVHGGEQGTPFLRYITGISAGKSGELIET